MKFSRSWCEKGEKLKLRTKTSNNFFLHHPTHPHPPSGLIFCSLDIRATAYLPPFLSSSSWHSSLGAQQGLEVTLQTLRPPITEQEKPYHFSSPNMATPQLTITPRIAVLQTRTQSLFMCFAE